MVRGGRRGAGGRPCLTLGEVAVTLPRGGDGLDLEAEWEDLGAGRGDFLTPSPVVPIPRLRRGGSIALSSHWGERGASGGIHATHLVGGPFPLRWVNITETD